MPHTVLDNPKKTLAGGGGTKDTSRVVVIDEEVQPSETSSLLSSAINNKGYDGYDPERQIHVRADSYSSTYEIEINTLQFTKSRVEHDSFYLSPSMHQKRHLGLFSVSLILISKMFGSGIFATPAIIYQNVDGSPVLFFTCWILGMTVGFGGMRALLELSSLVDKNGGIKTYLQFLYYKPKMLMNCVASILNVIFGYAIVNSIVFAKYFLQLIGILEQEENIVRYVALGLICFGTIMYGTNVKHAFFLPNAIGIVKLGLLVIITLSSVYILLPSKVTNITFENNLPPIWDSKFWVINWEQINLIQLSSAVLKCVFATGGYQGLVVFTGEVINPNRTMKIACPSAMFFIYTCYILINIAYLVAIPRDEMLQSDELIGAVLFGKIFGDSFGSKFLTASVAFSCFGNVLISIYSFGRVNQEAFREGFLPFSKIMRSNWPNNDTPLPGLLVSLAISTLILLFPMSDDMYDFIINLDSYPSNFFAFLIGIGIFKLRFQYSYLKNNYKAPIWSVFIYTFFSAFLMISPFIAKNGEKLFAYCGVSCLMGGAFYWCCFFKLLPWFGNYDLVQVEVIESNGGMTGKSWEKIYK